MTKKSYTMRGPGEKDKRPSDRAYITLNFKSLSVYINAQALQKLDVRDGETVKAYRTADFSYIYRADLDEQWGFTPFRYDHGGAVVAGEFISKFGLEEGYYVLSGPELIHEKDMYRLVKADQLEDT